MALLAKIIDETKNKHEKKRRVDEIRSTIERWKDKTHVMRVARNLSCIIILYTYTEIIRQKNDVATSLWVGLWFGRCSLISKIL